MQKHPDADSFVLEHLRHPANATTRLAFADWLDETGTPSNVAWASYIRLREEAERHGPELDRAARSRLDRCAANVRARLALAARVFVLNPVSVLQLIPAANVLARLTGFEAPVAVLVRFPESLARENIILPLAAGKRTLYCAAAGRHTADTALKVEFVLGIHTVLVRAGEADVLGAINRAYGRYEFEYSDSGRVENVTPPVVDWQPDPVAVAPIVQLVNLLLFGAVNRRADAVRLDPEPDALVVRELVGGVWADRDRIPQRLMGPVVMRLADMADIPANLAFTPPLTAYPLTGWFDFSMQSARFRATLTIDPSPDGPTTFIALAEAPW